MLTEPLKLLRIFAQNPLEHVRPDHRILLVPHLVQQLSVGLHQPAGSPQRVVRVEVVLEPLFEEILGQFEAVAQALEAAVHVARVAQVAQAHLPVPSVWTPFEAGDAFLQFGVSLGAAVGDVPARVLAQALLVAVTYSFAGAFDFQDFFLRAKLTLSYEYSLILPVLKSELQMLTLPELHNDVAVVESIVLQHGRRRVVRLQRVPRELNAAVVLQIIVVGAVHFDPLLPLANLLARVHQPALLVPELPQPQVALADGQLELVVDCVQNPPLEIQVVFALADLDVEFLVKAQELLSARV